MTIMIPLIIVDLMDNVWCETKAPVRNNKSDDGRPVMSRLK